MQILHKHFFSLKTDILAFTSFIPVYLLYVLFFETGWFAIPQEPPFLFFLLGWALVDGSHVYSTILVSYTDKNIWQQLKPLFLIVPLMLFVSAFAFKYSGSPQYFFYFLAYLAMIHFIRQEFGWMKIASRLDASAPKWLYYIDVNTSYLMTSLPMLWFLRESNAGFWYQKGDLFTIPDSLGQWALYLYWPVITIFLVGNILHTFRTKKINVSKFLVFINTFFGWYMAKVFVQHPYLALWLMIFHHGLPYYFIVFKTERVTQKLKFLDMTGRFKYPLIYLGCVCVFVLFFFSHSGNLYIVNLKKDFFFGSLVYAIAVVPQMTHFILDGFIWKKKYGLVGPVGSSSSQKN